MTGYRDGGHIGAHQSDLALSRDRGMLCGAVRDVESSSDRLAISADPTLVDSCTGDEPDTGTHPQRRLKKGQTLSRYVVLCQLGVGGMGVVYSAYDPELDRKVALKVLRTHGSGARAQARLLREAKAIARVRHPNVVTVHDVGTFEDQIFVAMEFVDGLTFRQWMADRPRSQEEIIDVLTQAGEGLCAAHLADLVHRDFKPDNVLVERSGRVVVLDFGLARRGSTQELPARSVATDDGKAVRNADQFNVELTRTGAQLGTPAYMAPEQHMSAPTDARSDQFAFCVVLWEALYGVRPFGGDDESTPAAQALKGELDEPPKGAKVPAKIRRILVRGLSTDPRDRYPTLRALLAELKRRGHPRRRRWLRMSAVVAGFAGVLGGVGVSMQTAPSCDGARERWDSVWDAEVRQDVRAAFMSTGLTYASAAWMGTQTALDEYVDTWVEMHREACEATHLHHEQSAEALDVRMACLRTRLSEAKALTAEFVEADGSVVRHAVAAARGLRRVELCGDASIANVPLHPLLSASGEALREQISEARAKLHAGHYDEALTLATDTVAAAAHQHSQGLLGPAQMTLAEILERRGNFEQAQSRLMEVVLLAEREGNHALLIDAWTRLVWVSGVERRNFKEAHLWARFAESAIERFGGTQLQWAMLTHNVGGLLYREGRLDQAVDHYHEALEVQKRILGPEDPAFATTLNHIGKVLIEQGKYIAAREYSERSLMLRRGVLGETHPQVAASLNNIAKLYREQNKPSASLEYARQALAISIGTGTTEEAVALSLMAWAFERLGQDVEAADAYHRLIVVRRELGASPEDIAEVMQGVARPLFLQGRCDEAVRWLGEAAALRGRDSSSEAAQIQVKLADCRAALGDGAGEAEAIRRALVLLGLQQRSRRAQGEGLRGRLRRRLRRVEVARLRSFPHGSR